MSAEDFIRFGARRYPAPATALVLLNHGSDLYVPPEMNSRRRRPHRRRPLFQTTRERLCQSEPKTRGIAYDDTSGDCLDNLELKGVLAWAHRILGRKLDLIGMDACLMTMLEVAYQIRDHAQVLVGSEEVEPGDGWPHDKILDGFTSRPEMTPVELGATIVHRYVEASQATGDDATQSAIDLGKLDDLVEAVDALARALLAGLRSASVAAALHLAWRRTLRFFEHSYVDLHHFASELARATDRRTIRQACDNVRATIEGKGARSPLIAEAHTGPRMGPARGLKDPRPVQDPGVVRAILAPLEGAPAPDRPGPAPPEPDPVSATGCRTAGGLSASPRSAAAAAPLAVCAAHAALDDTPVAGAGSPRESDQSRAVSASGRAPGPLAQRRWGLPGGLGCPPHASRSGGWR